jgi:acyl-CoA synthetase (AMP-forming)/AMP-acid ligase II
MLVADLLLAPARERAAQPAVWFENRWQTYGELGTAAQALAYFLQKQGVQPGERVALLLDNSFDYIVAHFGALAAGAVEVSLNTDLTADSLKSLLADCGAVALVAGRKFVRQWKDILAAVPSLRLIVTDLDPAQFPPVPTGVEMHALSVAKASGDGAQAATPRREEDLASIVYTSGSTGRPKGVMLSHRNLVSNTRSIVEYLGLKPDDRMLVVLPFHYIYGRSLLYTHCLSGGSIAIDNRFAFPVAILKTMEEQQVTCFAGVPSTFSILLRKTDVARRAFPHLRLLTQAGGPMAPNLQQEVARTFPAAKLCVMYGSTEAAPRLTYLAPEWLAQKAGSIGRAIPGVEVMVASEAGERRARGEVGEIAARGPNIMLGYWNDPEGTAAVLRQGWYFTGDLGYEDEDGCLFITGRARDIIKAGGNRVSAKDVEEKILELPEVVEVAVIGVADEILGEAIKAFVVVTGAAVTEAQVRAHLQRRLAPFAQPKFVEFTASLPKNQAGKILKAVLRERETAPTAR